MVWFDAVSSGSEALVDDWRVYDEEEMKPILRAAMEAIVEVGYHGTSIRKIADRCGLSVPGVYHHYASKHALLAAIMEFAMENLRQRTCLAIKDANGSTQREFAFYVECMVLFHATYPPLASTAQNEIRSLALDARDLHIQRRDRQHRVLEEIIEKGCKEGVFTTAYPRQATTAIITMCTGIAQWFRPDGELTPAELANLYQDFALRIVS